MLFLLLPDEFFVVFWCVISTDADFHQIAGRFDVFHEDVKAFRTGFEGAGLVMDFRRAVQGDFDPVKSQGNQFFCELPFEKRAVADEIELKSRSPAFRKGLHLTGQELKEINGEVKVILAYIEGLNDGKVLGIQIESRYSMPR